MMRNGNVYAFITDNLGSVTDVIDTSGDTDAAYAYDPYGNQVSATGGEDLFNFLGYTGALTDPVPDESAPATGYTHLGNRWQNPATGTFTQQDSLNKLANPASANTYAYAADNPANYIDPTGQDMCTYKPQLCGLPAYDAAGCDAAGLGFVVAVGVGFFGLATAPEVTIPGAIAYLLGVGVPLGIMGQSCGS
jgi:RHS repeat-associated protein